MQSWLKVSKRYYCSLKWADVKAWYISSEYIYEMNQNLLPNLYIYEPYLPDMAVSEVSRASEGSES